MLESVEWGEFKLGDLFEVQTSKKRFDANKVNVLKNGVYPYVVRMGTSNGQKGFIDEDSSFLNEGNTIAFGQDTATMFYQQKPYFTGDKIKILKPKESRFDKENAQFFISTMAKAFSSFSWGSSSFNVSIIKSQILTLPVDNEKIDFDFMERFITELEAERITELEAYLKASGLKDYHLTLEEQKALEDFESGRFAWCEFKFKDIFDQIKQGRRLKKDDQLPGDIPFVMSGVTDTGVVNYISNPIASFPRNSITVDIFGNAFYRSYDYGAGDDTGAYWSKSKNYSREMMLFFTSSINQALMNKFDYGNKLRSSQSLNLKMKLPSQNNQPDLSSMETLISAVQKLVIKDVVEYADKKIAAHEQAAKVS
ncbi:restriction endonuclease subunit S [Marinomonas algarum]|uniref:Restriction endonuclease subunit S n=1 Tax=Marinomonas algarum TaxID=2883105 RepID=A0A9X1ILT5_9GAMM|nr:restriction endonuclease subunit S [Marinomonas algarum]MCB5161583.1 restriction endonuclease subunit S [Marinomonas algarum]